jgi:hypothetical protein
MAAGVARAAGAASTAAASTAPSIIGPVPPR